MPSAPGHLLRVEAKNLSYRSGGAKDTSGAGDMPADVIVRRIDGVPDPAFGLYAKNESVQKSRSRLSAESRQRHQCGRHRAGRVDNRFQVRIVEIEYVAGDAIQHGGVQGIELLVAPK